MKVHTLPLLLYLMFFIVSIGSTFFTVRFIWVLYKIVELMCYINGDECKEALRKKYEHLGTNPLAYAEAHPLEIFICRIIGIILLIIFLFALISTIDS